MASINRNIVNRVNDKLLRRNEVMEMLRMKSPTSYYQFKRKSGIKVVKIGGIETIWQSDILQYLEDMPQNVA